jgi:hypothetical protein
MRLRCALTAAAVSTATQFEANSSGGKITAVNSVESIKESAPSLSHKVFFVARW